MATTTRTRITEQSIVWQGFDQFDVPSQTTPDTYYRVDAHLDRCTCVAASFGNDCAHRKAVRDCPTCGRPGLLCYFQIGSGNRMFKTVSCPGCGDGESWEG